MLIQSVAFRHLQLSPIALTAASRIRPQSPDGKLPAIASLPTAQTQRFAGKKVSLRRRQQADTPNHCSTWHKSIKYFYGMPATAMPFGLLSQVCHTACSSFAFVRAATVSFTPLRSLLPSLRFITPRSQLFICDMAGQALKQGTNHYTGPAPAIRKPTLQYSLGFIPLHFVIHSLQ